MTRLSHDFPPVAPAAPSVFSYAHPGQSAFRQKLIRGVEVLSGRRRFERLYERWRRGPKVAGQTIFTAGVEALRMQPDFVAGTVANIPARGGVLVVANHPYGIADGLMIGHLVAQVRGDVKLMVHSLLCRPPEAQGVLLPVDFGPGAEARRVSAETRRAAVDWLEAGHVLIIFPAGGVATSPGLFGRAADFLWHPFVGRLAQRPGVKVVPIWVGGQNSRLFHWVSRFSYPLRVALIFAETRARMDRAMPVAVGAAVDCSGLPKDAVAGHLRALTMGLGGVDPAVEFRFPKRIRC